MPTLLGLCLIVLFQLLGNTLVYLTGLPLSGPVVGMILLLIALILKRGLETTLTPAATLLLRHLPLLFVPAAVGIINHLQLLKDYGAVLLLTIVVSTLITLWVSAKSMSRGLHHTEANSNE